MTNKQSILAELEALEAQATPGPLEIFDCPGTYEGTYQIESADSVLCHDQPYYNMALNKKDAQLFVALRNNIKPLLEYVRQLEAVVEAAKDVVVQYNRAFDLTDMRFMDLEEALAALEGDRK